MCVIGRREERSVTTEYVETRMVPLAELTPFPGNARVGNRKMLLESLEANGQYRSLSVRDTGDGLDVLAGNNTLAALEERGDEAARCEIVTCDDATALRVNLVDNKANDSASYDERARARLLELLDGEITGTGYDEDEVDSIIARFEEPEEAPFAEPEVAEYNDDDAERAARIKSHGGENSRTYESRGVRDIFLALPADQADELGRLIMNLRETWGALSQGEVILKAARVAAAAYTLGAPESVFQAADRVYEGQPEADDAN
jgi:ParB-like chromosome segregation protein Spo0J